MTLAEMEASLYDTLGYKSSPDPEVVNRLRRYINQAYRRIISKKGIGNKVRKQTLPFTTVANNPFVALPQAVVKVRLIVDRTNGRVLYDLTSMEAKMRDPRQAFTTGTPYAFVPYNLQSPVLLDPSAAGQLTVTSTSAG